VESLPRKFWSLEKKLEKILKSEFPVINPHEWKILCLEDGFEI
jgi:hypothetical protein